ncbi:unnamed protein product [Allacma fusca]|uniref:Uncharacterized protein n=1 Tax=Allacma fusca TaxID=39272 RepID=A0A8J2JZD4_9HEXA|nr:unnamed protein product [Allacma fusca]
MYEEFTQGCMLIQLASRASLLSPPSFFWSLFMVLDRNGGNRPYCVCILEKERTDNWSEWNRMGSAHKRKPCSPKCKKLTTYVQGWEIEVLCWHAGDSCKSVG